MKEELNNSETLPKGIHEEIIRKTVSGKKI